MPCVNHEPVQISEDGCESKVMHAPKYWSVQGSGGRSLAQMQT